MDFINTFFLSFCTYIAAPLFCMEEEVLTPRTKLDQEELSLFKKHNVKTVDPKKVRDSDDIVDSIHAFLAVKREMKMKKLKKLKVSSDSDDDVRFVSLSQSDE